MSTVGVAGKEERYGKGNGVKKSELLNFASINASLHSSSHSSAR